MAQVIVNRSSGAITLNGGTNFFVANSDSDAATRAYAIANWTGAKAGMALRLPTGHTITAAEIVEPGDGSVEIINTGEVEFFVEDGTTIQLVVSAAGLAAAGDLTSPNTNIKSGHGVYSGMNSGNGQGQIVIGRYL